MADDPRDAALQAAIRERDEARQRLAVVDGNRDIWIAEANTLAAVALNTTRERDEARAEVERLRAWIDDTPLVREEWRRAQLRTEAAAPIAEGAPGPTDAFHATCPSCGAAVDVIPGVPLVPVAEGAQPVNGRLDDEFADYPDPPERTAARTDGEHETQASINQWQSKMFPDATLEGVLGHIKEEMREFLREPSAEEAADNIILLCCWAMLTGVTIQDAIDRKMAINRQRKWNIQADGTGRHVKHTDGEGR